MSTYPRRVLIALDQLGNAAIGGSPDETLSARAYRQSASSEFWFRARQIIDLVFWFEPDHCRDAYFAERYGFQLPKEYRRHDA